MCDYSLHSVRSRPAKIGDKLMTKDFGTGTRGFAPATDASTAVCVLPGTELAFASEVRHADWTIRSLIRGARVKTPHKTAIFRQINKGQEGIHRDALEFPMERLCSSHAYVKARRQPCSSSRRKRIRQ